MALDGALGQVQAFGDLTVGQAFDNQLEHLPLAAREGWRADARTQSLWHDDVAGEDRSHGWANNRIGSRLEDDPVRAGPEQPLRARAFRRADHGDRGPWRGAAQARVFRVRERLDVGLDDDHEIEVLSVRLRQSADRPPRSVHAQPFALERVDDYARSDAFTCHDVCRDGVIDAALCIPSSGFRPLHIGHTGEGSRGSPGGWDTWSRTYPRRRLSGEFLRMGGESGGGETGATGRTVDRFSDSAVRLANRARLTPFGRLASGLRGARCQRSKEAWPNRVTAEGQCLFPTGYGGQSSLWIAHEPLTTPAPAPGGPPGREVPGHVARGRHGQSHDDGAGSCDAARVAEERGVGEPPPHALWKHVPRVAGLSGQPVGSSDELGHHSLRSALEVTTSGEVREPAAGARNAVRDARCRDVGEAA